MKLPSSSMPRTEIMAQLRAAMADDAPWDKGKTFFLVYGVDEDHVRVLQEAHGLYIQTNGLGAGSMFPSIARLESEVIGMSAELLGHPGAVGNITSGGTESILMGIRSALERARAANPKLRDPELVVPVSAHPAFQKAAQIYGIREIRVPLRAGYVADVAAMAEAVNDRTVAIVGSAPNYPFGTIDPMSELSDLALKRKLHLHADCAVGAFALPFLRKIGENIPPFDFSLPGVATISADIHKYGFGERGSSLILYRDGEMQERAKFVLDDWSAGPYRTPTIAGSRPGAMVASAWAILHHFGEEGYLKVTRDMMAATRKLRTGIERLGFRVLGNPAMYLLAFTSDNSDIWAVGEAMGERGWHIHRQATDPKTLHLVVTPIHVPIVDDFLRDLVAAARQVREGGRGKARVASNYAAH